MKKSEQETESYALHFIRPKYEQNFLNNFSGFIIFTQPLRSGRIWHKVNF